jgi:hypothetical protein
MMMVALLVTAMAMFNLPLGLRPLLEFFYFRYFLIRLSLQDRQLAKKNLFSEKILARVVTSVTTNVLGSSVGSSES